MSPHGKILPFAVAGVFVFFLLAGCNQRESAQKPAAESVPSTVEARSLANGYNEFGFELFRRLTAGKKQQNLCFSPYSVASALALAQNGASGKTQEELRKLLHASSFSQQAFNQANQNLREALHSADPQVQLHTANSLWIRRDFPVKQPFLDLSQQFFAATVETLDFSSPDAATRINQWVKEKTNGKIDRMLDEQIKEAMVLYLLNAVYFKGTWTDEFEKSNTKDNTFHGEDGSARTVPFMERTDTFTYFQNAHCQMVSLPYGNERLSLWAVLPEKNTQIERLLNSLTVTTWRQWVGKSAAASGTVKLPRFKFKDEHDLIKPLQKMGAQLTFSPNADFSALGKTKPLWISEAKHKAVIEVNEEGTEAAAVTSLGFNSAGPPSSQEKGFVFTADRPFLVAIQEQETGSILFLCRVMQP